MSKITIQQQIDVLIVAKKRIISGWNIYMCVAINNGLDKINLRQHDLKNLVKFIPLLTIENAEAICRKYKLKLPKLERSNAWWDDDHIGKKSRLAVINWMLKELKAQL